MRRSAGGAGGRETRRYSHELDSIEWRAAASLTASMSKVMLVTVLCSAVMSLRAIAQSNPTSPPPLPDNRRSAAPQPSATPGIGAQRPAINPPAAGMPQMPNFPAGVGEQPGANNAIGAPPMPRMPEEPAALGARPMSPRIDEPVIPAPRRGVPIRSTSATAPGLISFLDSMTPVVQGIDFALMLFCAWFCLRRSKGAVAGALRLMALACFVSAIILLGFFLSATYHNQPLLPLLPSARLAAYASARLLAPFELLLFAAAIILVAIRSSR